MKIVIVFLLGFTLMTPQLSFKETQLKQERVKTAYEEKEKVVKGYFSDKNISFEKFQLFIRAFKKDQELEVWVKANGKESFELLHTFDFCTMSGVLGPKRKEGDLQIPEGVYHINHFNPQSNFYLSLGLNYPNASDKILSHSTKPGGSIYIHGNCVTIGCIPITDDKIKELYVLAVEARNNGQENIPVHVFPTRLNKGSVEKLITEINPDNQVKSFWKNLEPVYQDFESTKKLKAVKINSKGEYYYP
jgi:murein L,D-transpeptidase YafK